MFFKETFQFLSEKYGKDNIIVRIRTHGRTASTCIQSVTPLAMTRQERLALAIKVLFARISDFSQRFSKHMKEVFGRDISVYDDSERKKGV